MRNFLSLLGKIFLFIVFIVLSQLPLLLIESHYSMGIIAPLVILCYLILIGILLYIVKRVKGELPFKKITGKNVRFILAAYVVMILAKGILLTLMTKFYHQTISANDKALNALVTDRTAVLMTILVVVLVPITEELLYRGVFTSFFFKNQPFWQVAMSGVIFGLMHSSTNFISALIYVTMGWILAYVYVHTKNLSNSLTLHILNNAPFISVLFN
ncbi:CPBP family intramembrane glutamic endopeptidase [Ligilactobacillus salivarius]|uniref:CAAX protease n=2 Tax=Ligilactobacillus salivarius TaxID=1624 RepID=A0A9X6S525_9LACO|nr:type II CAAX endopeptidase family protein [Ligilactobacillus salivarius]PAY27145.1 CAAX protease [Ligilactobacillus salivarius]PAY29385.1 CAAX protease [Ligilactobacillus salivarius]PAY30702.1 CAAX protease [Ligilactobacillus salivarius]PAY33448.1 CAAX protease [Ligilactobacillus salivarius]PAY35870.1 CAAX protease [Ligilactobacillus salivarius]